MTKLVVVVGATGGQGGGVVQAFLDDPNFKVRGITRNTKSQRSTELAANGVEMVQADIGDEANLEKAFQGAHIIFAITDYYEHFYKHGKDIAMETETKHGINIAKIASKVPTLERFFWSTLPLTSVLSQGKAIVPHFESKGRVDAFIKSDLPGLFQKTVFCLFTTFAENMMMYPIFKPVWLESAKKYVQFYPTSRETPYPSLGDHRTNPGIFVRALARNPPEPGTYVRCNYEELTLESFLSLWGRASGKAEGPGSTKIVELSVQEYVELFGEMGEEQAIQCIFFNAIKGADPKEIEGLGFKMIDAQELMTEDEKSQLISTEESLKRIDWSCF